MPRIPVLFLLALLASCAGDDSVRPSSLGRLSELVVVADSTVWNGPAGTGIRQALQAPFPGLPQEESRFHLSVFSQADFDGIVPLHRNILKISRSQDGKARIASQRDVWSAPQLVLEVSIPTAAEGQAAGQRALRLLEAEERARLILGNRLTGNKKLYQAVSGRFGFGLHLPDDYFLATDTTGFIWMRRETENTSTGILVYATPPYTMTGNGVLHVRDSVCRIHIPGPAPGSYMATDSAFATITYQDSIAGLDVLLIRGLWRTEGDFMGGPFLSATFSDRPDRMITIEGFVYAPRFEKRDYMKRVEAIIYSAGLGE